MEISRLLGILGALYTAFAQAPTAFWGTVGGNSQRSGIVQYVANATEAQGVVQWTYASNGLGEPQQLVLDAAGNAYITCSDSYVRKITQQGKRIAWSFYVGKSSRISSPTASSDGMLYFIAAGYVFALETSSGGNPWATQLSCTGCYVLDAYKTSVLIVNDNVVAYSDSCGTHALNRATGDPLWSYSAGALNAPPSSPTGEVVVLSNDGRIVGLSATTGAVVWQTAAFLPSAQPSALTTAYIGIDANRSVAYALYGGNVYAASIKGSYSLLRSAATGTPSSLSNQLSIAPDGTIYVSNTALIALSPVDGSVRWKAAVNATGGSALGPDGSVYQASSAGFFSYSSREGSVNWKYPAGSNGRVASNAATDANELVYCIVAASSGPYGQMLIVWGSSY